MTSINTDKYENLISFWYNESFLEKWRKFALKVSIMEYTVWWHFNGLDSPNHEVLTNGLGKEGVVSFSFFDN